MERPDHILIVDDDAEIRTLLGRYLEKNGLRTTAVADGRAMWQALDRAAFDLIVLDLMLPGDDGLTLCRTLRTRSDIPVIMLTARGEETDRIVGLEMGADDYLTKPFEMRELSARIKAVLRRTSASDVPANDKAAGTLAKAPRLLFSGWVLDRRQYQLFDSEGKPADLTSGEFRLLEALVSAPNRVLSREQLFELTRSGEFDSYDRAIDIQIARIRKKLQDDPKNPELIKTVRGVGYMFTGDAKASD